MEFNSHDPLLKARSRNRDTGFTRKTQRPFTTNIQGKGNQSQTMRKTFNYFFTDDNLDYDETLHGILS